MISTSALHGKHLLSLADVTPDEIMFLIELAAELKAAKEAAAPTSDATGGGRHGNSAARPSG